ncbi:signal peptidase II [Chloroflexota bacterium]
MRRASSFWGKRWRTIVFFLVALAIAIGDQASKEWIRSNILVNESLPEEGFLRLTHVQNTGAAFGIFQDHTFPLTIISFIGAAVILFYAFYVRRCYAFLNNGVSMAALGAVLGGTVGNLIDRLSLGYVTDFIAVGTFPAFNVADSSITTGASVFAGSLIYLLVKEQQEAKEKQIASHSD